METFFWTALLALVGALTVVAYREPEGYHRLYLVLTKWMMVIVAMAGVWALSNTITTIQLLDFVPETSRETAQRAATKVLFFDWRGPVIYLCLITYMLFLGNLRRILGGSPKPADMKADS